MKRQARSARSGSQLRARQMSNQGAACLQRGEVDQAISLLTRAYELMPDDVATAINPGGAYILHKRYREAIPILEKALEQELENEMIWTNLGAGHPGNPITADDKQQRKAIEAFERAIEINPIAPNVHYNLGVIHRDRGEVEQAALRFRQAIQANPHDRDARRALSRLESQRDEPPEQDPSPGSAG